MTWLPPTALAGLAVAVLATATGYAADSDGLEVWAWLGAGVLVALSLVAAACHLVLAEKRNPRCESCDHRASSHRQPRLAVGERPGASRCYAPVQVNGDYESCGCPERFESATSR